MPHTTQGMNWIRKEKRIAIYERDLYICWYCEESGKRLTLDHLRPKGGNNPRNLITACVNCNSSKKGTPLHRFVPDKKKRQAIYRQARKPIRKGPRMRTYTLVCKDDGTVTLTRDILGGKSIVSGMLPGIFEFIRAEESKANTCIVGAATETGSGGAGPKRILGPLTNSMVGT